MALFSLLLLLLAIVLGFTRKMNTGLVCIGLSLVLGRVAGISDGEVIKGFNSSLFLMLLGVMYLFSIAQVNGSLELVAKKIVALTGKRVYLVPVVVYFFCAVLSAVGPGCLPTMAIMMVFAMAMSHEMGIHPAMLSALVVLGASGGGVSPLAATGIIGADLCAAFGLTHIEVPFFLNGMLSTFVFACIVYVALGGYKLRVKEDLEEHHLASFNTKQKITLFGICVMVVLVMGFKMNVGLVSFAVAAALSFLRVSDEAESIRRVPWSTLLLINGVGVLMNLIIKLGGIDMLSTALESIMTEGTAVSIMGLCSGILSWFSSTSGVVMPTFIPTIPHIAADMGGQINELEMASAITMVAHLAGMSPLSTGGALALAAYSGASGASSEEQNSLFIKMFAISASGVLTLSALAYFGLFHWIL